MRSIVRGASKDERPHQPRHLLLLLLRSRRSRAPSCKLTHRFPIRTNKSFLLGPAPALELPLRGDAVGYPIEIFGPQQHDWTPRKGVSWIGAGIVPINSLGHVLAGG